MYYTVRLGVNSGIGAQLQQLALVLNIGKFIKGEFVNIEDRNFCQRSGLDVFEKFHLRKCFHSTISSNYNFQFSPVILSDSLFNIDENDTSLKNDDLFDLFKGFKNENIDFVFKDWSLLKNLRRLRPDLLKRTIFREYNFDRQSDFFPQEENKYLIHIRAGDVAILDTPYGKISCWGVKNGSNLPDFVTENTELSYKSIDLNFLNALVRKISDANSHAMFVIISDGFNKSIERIKRYKDRLSLDNSAIEKIEEEYSDDYYEKKINAGRKNIEFIIGDSVEKTMLSVKQLQTSAVILHGSGSFVPTILSALVSREKTKRRYNYHEKNIDLILKNEVAYIANRSS